MTEQNKYMEAFLKDAKIVQVIPGSRCDNCKEIFKMNEGVLIGILPNGKRVVYCKKNCYIESKLYGYV